MMMYLVCAKEFGWTPEQVNKTDNKILQSMLVGLEELKRQEEQALKQNG